MSFFYETEEEYKRDVDRFVQFRKRVKEHREYTDSFFAITCPTDEELKHYTNVDFKGYPVMQMYVNITGMLAMALCRRDDSCQAIKELYLKYERIMLKVANTSPLIKSLGVMKFVIPGEKINYYKMALCLLEASAECVLETDEEHFDIIADAKCFGLTTPYLGLYSSFVVDIDPDIQEELRNEIMYIAKKYNNRIVRKLKRMQAYDIEEYMQDIRVKADSAVSKDQIGPSYTRASVAADAILEFYIGAFDMEIYFDNVSTLIDGFFLAVTPLELSIDFINTQLVHDAAQKDKVSRAYLKDISSEYMQMVNFINSHAACTTTDELLHIANCSIEQFLIPLEKNITEDEFISILTVLYKEETLALAPEPIQEFIVGISIYVVLVAKAYRRFLETYNEELNLSTISKLHGISEQEQKYEKELSKLRVDIQNLTDKLEEKERTAATTDDELRETIRRLETENKRLKQQISSKDDNKKELTALREYMYHQEDSVQETEGNVSIKDMRTHISDKRITVIGGHPNWMNKLKESFPSWEYIPIGVNTFPKEKVANSELVVIVSNFCKHSMYYRVISAIEEEGTADLMYLNGGNIDLCIRNIYEQVMGLNK